MGIAGSASFLDLQRTHVEGFGFVESAAVGEQGREVVQVHRQRRMFRSEMAFAKREDLGLTKAEFAVLRRLDSPRKIQAFLYALKQNFEPDGDTCRSVREVLLAELTSGDADGAVRGIIRDELMNGEIGGNISQVASASGEMTKGIGTVASRFNDSGVNGLYAALWREQSARREERARRGVDDRDVECGRGRGCAPPAAR